MLTNHSSNTPSSVDGLAIDPDEVVRFVTDGGRDAVIRVVAALRGKPGVDEVLHTLAEAVQEARATEPAAVQRGPVPESFISRAARLDVQGYTDDALDLIYDAVDELLRNGQFAKLDALLVAVPVPEYSVDILLGILTATLPAKSQLPSRTSLMESTRESLVDRGEYTEGLLTGLE